MKFCFIKMLYVFKRKIPTFISVLGILISTQSMAFTATFPKVTCLPTNVYVLDENGNNVLVNRFELEKNSLFKGSLVPGNSPGSVQYSSSNESIASCSHDRSAPSDKVADEAPSSESYPKYFKDNLNSTTSTIGIGKYIAKVVDIDNDGKSDIYIEATSLARSHSFYLLQRSGLRFELHNIEDYNYSGMAIHERFRFHPSSDIAVTRADYSADGLYDFLIANIDEYIPGSDDLIIITKRGNTKKVGKSIPIDTKFREVRNGIELINGGGATDSFVGLFDNNLRICITIYIPYTIWSWAQERWVTYWIPYSYCYGGNNFLRNNLKHSEHYDYIESLSKMNTQYGLNNFQGAAGSWHGSVYDKVSAQLDHRQLISTAKTVRSGVQIWRNGSITATVILIADDATVVGIIDDVGLIATLSSIGISIIVLEALDYYIAEMGVEPNDDTGEEDNTKVGAGTFAIPSTCNPQTPGQNEAGSGTPTSERLRDNLNLSGCWCDSADVTGAAHHIIPKKQGGEIGEKLRNCVKNRNIDLDSATNGVCLPYRDTDRSDAFPHKGSEGNLHGKETIQALLDLCEDNNISDRQFEAKLRDIAEGYTKGELRFP